MTILHEEPVEPHETDQPWRKWASFVVLFIVAFGTLCGLVLIPVVQGMSAGVDPWTAICRAVGILPGSPALKLPASTAQAHPTTEVAWTPAIMTRLSSGKAGQGAQAAEVCGSCHGAQGISPDPQFPDLAGQSAFAIYKQLHDYKNGARVNELMSGVVQELGDEQMADVAVHWASRVGGVSDPRIIRAGGEDVRILVERGDIARGVPACNSCHSGNAGGPIETPTLTGQRAEYIEAQLRGFRSGDRRNDIYNRMRSIAVKLTDDEIRSLSRFYARPR